MAGKPAALLALALAAMPAQAQEQARSPAGIAAADVKALSAWLLGTWTNEEQVYFTQETDSAAAKVPWARLEISAAGNGRFDVRRFPSPTATEPVATDSLTLTAGPPGAGITLTSSDGCAVRLIRLGDQFSVADGFKSCKHRAEPLRGISATSLFTGKGDGVTGGMITAYRKARPFTCWIAAPKRAKKADGTTDWFGAFGVKLHDQGGRAWVETDEPQPQKIGLKLRNVVWPYGNNRPAITLYVYTGDEPERAASYSWADPGAERVGINTRWMQASCTLETTGGT